MEIVKYGLLDEKIVDLFIRGKQDCWTIYNYLSQFAQKGKWLDLYIPEWLYEYLKKTELENYEMTLFKALESDFHIYGVTSEHMNDELLIIDYKK